MDKDSSEGQVDEIIVVDDTPANLRLVREVLSGEGIGVRPFRQPLPALEAARQRPPHLILLDILMPEVDGFEWCRRFKALPDTAYTPVIFLTALSQTVDKVRAFEVGGVDFITKPFSPPELLARTRLHLSLARMKRQEVARARQLEEALHRLQRLEEGRKALSRSIVHDLQNPLSTIVMNATLLRDTPAGSDESDEIISDLVVSAERALNMLGDILSVVSAEDSALRPLRRMISLERLCRDAIRDCCKAAGAPGGAVRLHIDATDAFSLDPDLMRRVLINLISNALKFSSRRVGVTVQVRPAVDAGVRFSVSDRGPGVPPAHRESIFDPFTRVGDPAGRSVRGWGLGLAFCRLAVQAHGGRIWCDATPGGGARFHVTLPAPESHEVFKLRPRHA